MPFSGVIEWFEDGGSISGEEGKPMFERSRKILNVYVCTISDGLHYSYDKAMVF